MGTKLLLGFGGTVIQVVVHRMLKRESTSLCFGGTVIQVVVHLVDTDMYASIRFGGTVNQAVVYQARPFHRRARVSELP